MKKQKDTTQELLETYQKDLKKIYQKGEYSEHSFRTPLENLLKAHFSPVISNVNAKPYTDKTQALALLKSQLVSPVLYKQSIKSVEDAVDAFVEFGSAVLKGLNKKISPKKTHALTTLNEMDEFLKLVK